MQAVNSAVIARAARVLNTHRSIEPLTLTAGTALLQNVDDLLICAKDKTTCISDTVTLLKHLEREGHKASLSKLQFVKQEVTFLGHVT